jgi:hypothetical protein
VKLINGENDAETSDTRKPGKKEKTKAGKAKRNKSTNSDVEAALLGLPKKVCKGLGYFAAVPTLNRKSAKAWQSRASSTICEHCFNIYGHSNHA